MTKLKEYPNGKGGYLEHDDIRVELYHDGSWTVYTIQGPFRCIASGMHDRATDIEGARVKAREAFKEVRRMRDLVESNGQTQML